MSLLSMLSQYFVIAVQLLAISYLFEPIAICLHSAVAIELL